MSNSVKRICGRLQRYHEVITGRLTLAIASGVSFGSGCRAGYGLRLRSVMDGRIVIGDGTSFDRWVDLFAHHGLLDIGNGCHFGKGCVIVTREAITIGPGCQIAENVTIRDQDHRTLPDRAIAESGYETAPIIIGAHVWIGAGAKITKGVTIGDHSVIGAGAVVTRDISPGARAVGVPARELPSKQNPYVC